MNKTLSVVATEPGPVSTSGICLFNPDGDEAHSVELRNLPFNEEMIRLIESSYCRDPENKEKNEIDFQPLSKLARIVPLVQVNFPYDFSQLSQLREAVLAAPMRG